VADHVALLQGGRVRATGSPHEVFTSERLTETYGIPIAVTVDPVTRQVTTRPVGRHSHRLSAMAAV